MNHANSINYKLKVRKKHPINLPKTTTKNQTHIHIKKCYKTLAIFVYIIKFQTRFRQT